MSEKRSEAYASRRYAIFKSGFEGGRTDIMYSRYARYPSKGYIEADIVAVNDSNFKLKVRPNGKRSRWIPATLVLGWVAESF